jgi:Holliday junction resolvase
MERDIVAATRALLVARRAWVLVTHGGPHMPVGTPDIIGCCEGRFFALEVKQPGKRPTPIQSLRLEAIAEAGGIAAVVHSSDEALAALVEGL